MIDIENKEFVDDFSNYLRYCIEVRVGWNVGKICIVEANGYYLI